MAQPEKGGAPQVPITHVEDADFDPVAYINTPRWHSVSLGLDRTRELLAGLGNPQNSLRFIHVAGTNGKGSTCAFLASIFQEAGYKVGLFTSPYIVCFEERIRINGNNISPDSLREVTLQVRAVAEAMAEHPTEFELMTAVAFLYFAQQECDIVIAEVGLGGRLDSTNVIETVEASVIAPIAIDHSAMLGNTIAEIAAEKAGIIKPGVPVISAPQHPDARAVLCDVAQACGTPITFVDDTAISGPNSNFSAGKRHGLSTQLAGSYQRFNAATALAVCEILQTTWQLSDEALRSGVAHAAWPGRFEYVGHNPDVIIDGAHNVQGMSVLAQELRQRYEHGSVTFVVGLMADKDYATMLPHIVPLAKRVICIKPNNPRALPAQDLAQAVIDACKQSACTPNVLVASSISEGVNQAFEGISPKEAICFCGSLYAIGDVKQALQARCPFIS